MVPGRISLPVHRIFIYNQDLLLRQCCGREWILCVSGDHVRNAVLPTQTSALTLAARRSKAVQGGHASTATFCGPFSSCPPCDGTAALGTSACTSFPCPFSIRYRSDVHELVDVTAYAGRLEGKFSYVTLTDVSVG